MIESSVSHPNIQAKVLNGTTLAYIGDAVMSLWVREYLMSQGLGKPKVLQKQSEHWVSAKAQCSYLQALLAQSFFTEEERSIVMRGRNAKTESKAKHASVYEYRMATGLEAVIGYLYLNQEETRLQALWSEIVKLGERT